MTSLRGMTVLLCIASALGLACLLSGRPQRAATSRVTPLTPVSAPPTRAADWSPASYHGGAPLEPDPDFCEALRMLLEAEREDRRSASGALRLAAGEHPDATAESRREALLRNALQKLDKADTSPPTRDRNPETRRLVRAWCEAQRSRTLPLGKLERVVFRYAFGPEADPSRFLDYSLQCYTREPEGDPIFHAFTKGFFADKRLEVLQSHLTHGMPPLEGKTVAVVRCSLGEELPWVLQRVGRSGTVWAEEQEPSLLAFLEYAQTHGLPELSAVRRQLGTPLDVRLAPRSCDVVLCVQGLHAYQGGQGTNRNATVWFGSIREALRRGGCLVILEDGRHIDKDFVLRHLEATGFRVEFEMPAYDGCPGPRVVGFLLRAVPKEQPR